MEIVGYIASLFIGVSLGLVGAGGSILTVPVMVYLFHVPVLTATSYSLFVVGVTSLLGAIYQYKEETVNTKIAVLFSLVSLLLVFVVRHYLLPQIPAQLFLLAGVPVTFSLVSILLFSVLMVLAARAMLRPKVCEEGQSSGKAIPRLLLCAVVIGIITGFLGAGGGFILIPALVLLLRLSMKCAIGTSLMIIALNSLFGFAVDIGQKEINWQLLVLVTAIAGGGIFLGMAMGKNLSAAILKISFGWMVMVIGVVIMIKEIAAFIVKI